MDTPKSPTSPTSWPRGRALHWIVKAGPRSQNGQHVPGSFMEARKRSRQDLALGTSLVMWDHCYWGPGVSTRHLIQVHRLSPAIPLRWPPMSRPIMGSALEITPWSGMFLGPLLGPSSFRPESLALVRTDLGPITEALLLSSLMVGPLHWAMQRHPHCPTIPRRPAPTTRPMMGPALVSKPWCGRFPNPLPGVLPLPLLMVGSAYYRGPEIAQ